MIESQYTIMSSLIDKRKYSHFNTPDNPYSVGTKFGVERAIFEIQEHEQRGRKIPIIFESRRRNEDRTLEEEFKKMVEQSNLNGINEYLQLSRPLIIPFQGHRYCQRRPVADRFKATDPLWSGFEHGLSVPLPHVELAGVDPYRVVHDAVEDGVGDGVAAETAVPFLGGQLGRERGAGVVVAQFHELKQEAPELLVGLVHEPRFQ